MLLRFPAPLVAAALLLAAPGFAQTGGSPETVSDSGNADGGCGPAVGDRELGDHLTRAERIALLDQDFFESLLRFERCSGGSAGAASGNGSGGEGGGLEGDGGAAQAAEDGEGGELEGAGDGGAAQAAEGGEGAEVESVASTSISGTEAPRETGGQTDAGADSWDADAGDWEAGTGVAGLDPAEAESDLPADIPPSDNDSVLEAQIRRAALEETDPEVQAELWNEYRKYKNLPQVP